MKTKNITVEVRHGVHRPGESYPEHDFEHAARLGITNTSKVIACSNLEVRDQIDRLYEKSPDSSEVHYFYFYYGEDKTPL